jgi:hypothetical protein
VSLRKDGNNADALTANPSARSSLFAILMSHPDDHLRQMIVRAETQSSLLRDNYLTSLLIKKKKKKREGRQAMNSALIFKFISDIAAK